MSGRTIRDLEEKEKGKKKKTSKGPGHSCWLAN